MMAPSARVAGHMQCAWSVQAIPTTDARLAFPTGLDQEASATDSSQRSASMAAMHPEPAAVMACRYS